MKSTFWMTAQETEDELRRRMELTHCVDCGEPYDLLPCNRRHANKQESRIQSRNLGQHPQVVPDRQA
jgi:hypothetical protein